MWERNTFNTGSVNFDNNCIAFTMNSSDNSLSSQVDSPKPHVTVSRNSNNYSNSVISQNDHHRSTSKYTATQTVTRRPNSKQLSHSSNSVTHFPKNYNPALYKTELCRQFCDSGTCDYGEKCLFAHGKHELKQISNYRTKLCVSWVKGYCQFGSNCMFIHPPSESHRGGSSNNLVKNGHHRANKVARIGH